MFNRVMKYEKRKQCCKNKAMKHVKIKKTVENNVKNLEILTKKD